jgi:D-glycero-alpha-D-manno-heptose 1-phosphate guanylyltransferase
MLIDAVIVLCGGFGTRFQEISTDPKILANIGAFKFVDYLLAQIEETGIEKVIFSTHFKSDVIKQYFSAISVNQRLSFIEEKNPLGTGGAITNVIRNTTYETFLVLNADTYWNTNFSQSFLNLDSGVTAKLLVKKIAINDRYGEIRLSDPSTVNFRRGTVESPLKNSPVFIGAAVVKRDFASNALTAPYSFEDRLQLGDLHIELEYFSGAFLDFGTTSGYADLLSQKGQIERKILSCK